MKTELRYITGEGLVEEIRKKCKKRRIITGIILFFGIFLTVFFFMVAIAAGITMLFFVVLIPLAVFLYYCSKIKKIEKIAVFQRYGTPDELAAMLRNSSDSVLYQANNFLLTSNFIMNPNDLESIIPLTALQLAYIHTSSYNGIPTSQTLKTHDIYNNQLEYSFKLGKKSRAQITDILVMIHQHAPWVVVGYSPQNVRDAAKNKIKIGDPKPVRQLPQPDAPVYPDPNMQNPNAGGFQQ